MTDESEQIRSDGYKRYVKIESCECDGPGVMSGIAFKDDGMYCSSCGKKLIIEEFILFGCCKTEKNLRELNKIEKDFYKGEKK